LKNRTYHIKQQGIVLSRDAQGKESIAPFTSELSFDGKIYREWHIGEHSDKTLSQNTQGVISTNLDDCILNKQFIESGYAGVGIVSGIPVFINLPSFLNINPCSFSDLLTSYNKNKKVISGEIRENNEISIIFSDEFELSGNKISLTFDILFDTVNSVIAKQRVYYTYTSPIEEYSATTSEFLIDGGKKIPQKIIFKQIYGQVILQTNYFFENFEINPPIVHDEFQISFPDGVYVEDYVLKLFYKVGDIIDEDKAIARFMTRHGLTGNVPMKLTSGGILRYVLMGAGCLMILKSLILHIRKRRQSQ
jgi:hypothetical protein